MQTDSFTASENVPVKHAVHPAPSLHVPFAHDAVGDVDGVVVGAVVGAVDGAAVVGAVEGAAVGTDVGADDGANVTTCVKVAATAAPSAMPDVAVHSMMETCSEAITSHATDHALPAAPQTIVAAEPNAVASPAVPVQSVAAMGMPIAAVAVNQHGKLVAEKSDPSTAAPFTRVCVLPLVMAIAAEASDAALRRIISAITAPPHGIDLEAGITEPRLSGKEGRGYCRFKLGYQPG